MPCCQGSGDRDANAALHTIATVRWSSDTRTKQFVSIQRAKGRSNPEILRIFKRAIAREAYKTLSRPNTLTDIEDLRRTRREKNLPLRKVVEALGTSQIHVSRIERGLTKRVPEITLCICLVAVCSGIRTIRPEEEAL